VNICILGAGGLGSVMGGRLAETGVDVTFVARPAHVDAISRNGLRITGSRGESVVTEHLRAVTDADAATGEFDYTILLVKANDTAATLARSGSLGDRSASVLSLQNTVVKEAVLAACQPRSGVGADIHHSVGATMQGRRSGVAR